MKSRILSRYITILATLLTMILTPFRAGAENPVSIAINRSNTLPVGQLDDRSISLITIGPERLTEFETIAGKYAMIESEHLSSSRGIHEAIDLAMESDLVIIGVSSSEQWARGVFDRLVDLRPAIVVFFLSPDEIRHFRHYSGAAAMLIATNADTETQSIAAQTIFGGRNSVAINHSLLSKLRLKSTPAVFEKSRLGYVSPTDAGFNASLGDKIDSIVNASIKAHAFPGCQVVVARHGNVVIDKAYGTYGFDNNKPVTRNTLFDIASITKATATVAGLMKAYDEGLFKLDAPMSDYLPRLKGTDKAALTVRDFLYHETGLPASVNIHSLVTDTASYSGRLFSSRCAAPNTIKVDRNLYGNVDARLRPDMFSHRPSSAFNIEIAKDLFATDSATTMITDALYSRPAGAKRYLYSDINFCLLKEMEEAVTERSHDHWIDSRIFLPLGAHYTTYCPVSNGWDAADVAPTERDNFLRRQHLQGYVHDETAAFLGGVSGNAGLFSTAGDIAKLCQTWLNGGRYGDKRLFSDATVRLFTTSRSSAERGLGFDRAWRLKSMRDTGIGNNAYGHTGFTGTCFWIDPDKQIIIIILTNRINPTRDNNAFSNLSPRTRIVEAVYQSITD